MAEPKEVCRICFSLSSHKPTPTLTTEERTTIDYVANKKLCSVCRHEWTPIRICKDIDGSARWVRVRPRPKIPANIDFQICKNVNTKTECPKGQECSFAHSKAELSVWNRERQNEPRPAPHINGPYQYQLCKHMLNTGNCPYGQRCTFAHSDEELKEWLKVQAGAHLVQNGNIPGGFSYQGPPPVPPNQFNMNTPSSSVYPPSSVPGSVLPLPHGSMLEYRCDVCSLSCTSKKQLDDHISGSRHKQQVAVKALHAFNNPTQVQSVSVRDYNVVGNYRIRKRPTLSFAINGYKMCLHIQAKRRCIYGDYCTFAHSQAELEQWNRQLQVSHAPPRINPSGYVGLHNTAPALGYTSSHSVPASSSAGGGAPMSAMSGLDDFEDDLQVIPQDHDFALLVRSKLVSEHNKSTLSGFEKTCDSVTILEVSGRELSLVLSHSRAAVEWVFEISVTTPRILQSVVLFDTLASDFEVANVSLVHYNGEHSPLKILNRAHQGIGLQYNQKIAPPDKIRVQIKLVPRSGLLGQLVLFDFGSSFMARGMTVHVLTDSETRMMDISESLQKRRKHKPDLYWEQRYSKIPMAVTYIEETDSLLPEYPLPEQIEKLIEAGKYNNVENKVTKENYRRRMHNLLYLEEYQQRVDMSRYDLYDIEITSHPNYTTPTGSQYAPPGYFFVKLTVEEILYEGGKSIRPGDGALLLPLNQLVIHECHVEHVGRDSVIIKITDKAKQACASSANRGSVRFVLSRIPMRSMHYAVDHLDLSTIFPSPHLAAQNVENPSAVEGCLEDLKGSELYTSQQDSITSMLDSACRTIPSLVLGPFGCGKTRTLGECIKLLSLFIPDTHILICTHSNSAANLYVESIDHEWKKRGLGKAPMFRLYFTGRRLATITPIVKQYCRIIDNQRLVVPTLEELKQFKIVVATLSTSRTLALMGLNKGHFSHIFIDEAAQALESESVIPLCLANEQTKIVLAGDHMQMDPPVYSSIARKYGLHVSLLERLYDHEAYNEGVGMLCKTLLTENHRSHAQILELPSKLFYKNRLTCKAVFPPTGPKNIPAIKFIGVDGRETQEEDSPSFYNDHEASKIVEEVQQLVSGGLRPEDVCVVSYYHMQVFRIRFLLRQRKLGKVMAFRVDDVQGKEFRALLLSTVRTCSNEPTSDEEAGFLTNPKLFNTAVTRAKEWLIVVGEPITLCTIGSNRTCWMEFITKCHQLGSFEYPNADEFESCLENKIVCRQVLEKVHEGFFTRMKSVLHPSAQVQQQQQQAPPSTLSHPHTSTPSQPGITYLQANPQHHHQVLRSKVTEVTQSGDEQIIQRITEDLMKLSLEQQVFMLANPQHLSTKVREYEQILRRAGPTAAVMNAARMQQNHLVQKSAQINNPSAPGITSSNNPFSTVNPQSGIPTQLGPIGSAVVQNMTATGLPPPQPASGLINDLPPFLRGIMEGVTLHLRWCDGMLLSNNPVVRDNVRENILRQKANLTQQTKLVNEQIFLYKEFLKAVKSSQMKPPTMAPNVLPSGAPTATPIVPQSSAHHPKQMMMQQALPAHSTGHSHIPAQTHETGNLVMPSAIPPVIPSVMPPGNVGVSVSAPGVGVGGSVKVQQVGGARPLVGGPMSNSVGGGFVNQSQQPQQPAMVVNQDPLTQAMSQNMSQYPVNMPSAFGHTQPMGLEEQSNVNSAFTYGVSAYLPNTQDHLQQPPRQSQLSVQTNLAPGSRPIGAQHTLDAAISASSSRSSPSMAQPHPPQLQDSELYVSDDEFN